MYHFSYGNCVVGKAQVPEAGTGILIANMQALDEHKSTSKFVDSPDNLTCQCTKKHVPAPRVTPTQAFEAVEEASAFICDN